MDTAPHADSCMCTDCLTAHPLELTKVVHKFELAGLGKAPFHMVGFETKTYQASPGAPIQPGGSCDYCGTGICLMFYIRSADKKTFKVGSDCVHKTDDKGLKKIVDERIKIHNRELRAKRADAVKAGVEASLSDESLRRELAARRHPRGFINRDTNEPMTLLDWADWMLKNAGDKGRREIAKAIKTVQKETDDQAEEGLEVLDAICEGKY